MQWEATTARPWSCREPRSRSSAIRKANSSCSATRRRSRRCSTVISGSRPRRSIVHTDVAVRMDDKPSQALRQGRRNSSMWLALDAVRHGEADVAVSAGNTGALMAMAKFCLQDDAGHRPSGDRRDLAESARRKRGAGSRRVDRRRREAACRHGGDGCGDGAHRVRSRAADGRASQCRRRGDQGHRGRARGGPHLARGAICRNSNIAASSRATTSARARWMSSSPRALPATSRSRRRKARRARSANICAPRMNRTWRARIGYLFARDAFKVLREKVDPQKVNGGVFLGLNGVVVKSHGGADAEGFASAIDTGYDVVRNELTREDRRCWHRAWPAHQRNRMLPKAGRIMTIRRSVVRGVGAYLPNRIMTNDELSQNGRHDRRMDPAAHGHPRAPYRGRRRIHLASWDRGGARGARQCRRWMRSESI